VKKEIGFIGLGKMGTNMVLNLLDKKYRVVVYNRSPEAVKKLERRGAVAAADLNDMVSKMKSSPKVIWVMVTAGKAVDEIRKELLPNLNKGDIIIDGGNSFYKKSEKRAKVLKKRGINFIDCGVSGGIEGARSGACLMVGGDKAVYKKIEPLFRDMAVKDGYGYMGKSGAGHFVKGVHNGIEYGMLGALNEGLEAIKSRQGVYGTDLKEVARVYDNGSIVEGRLTHWLYGAFKKPNYLDEVSCEVPIGETEEEMKSLDKEFNMPILHQAHLARMNSRKMSKGVCGKFIAVVRREFGGHGVKKK